MSVFFNLTSNPLTLFSTTSRLETKPPQFAMTTKGVSNPSEPTQWDSAAAQYNDAVGRSSRIGATRLIAMADSLSPLSAADAHAIDLGAGTGSLTHQLASSFPAVPILATDISPGMLEQLMALNVRGSKITTQVADMAAPVGGEAAEGAFSHVFSTMAIQVLPEPASEGTLAQWSRLLKPDGVIAIAIWDFDEDCGPHAIWNDACRAVDPSYVPPPQLPPRSWTGCSQLEEGLKVAGFRDVQAEVTHLGFDVGKEGFLRFFWESGNPMTLECRGSFHGDLGKVRTEMERLLDEVYGGGSKIPLSAGLAVGRRPDT
ncbi:S-adenosyl-L-methionine-dependent methyltransferase [Amylocarpus encephaloides]|uniref:S-adenosyl-L-methionine-dependent methyltransferase n=1 Tax=Amylocarpus encephaloides TaxID=45428 RepID=A0A9P7YKN7_9HELO|nr:S-adenosyl-L-methionine-dependent methyltransferase [Amylocarpus encephaloides]